MVRNMRKWILETFPYFVMVCTFIIGLSFLYHPFLQQYWPSFFPDFVATVCGVLLGASIALLEMMGRQKGAHTKFMGDVFNELNKMPELLTGKGNILNTDIWASGISSGSILGINSKELGELSSLYQQIDNNVYEAKICRQAGEFPKRLPSGTHQEYAQKHWNKLSFAMQQREEKLRKRIEAYLKQDFWEKVGVTKKQ